MKQVRKRGQAGWVETSVRGAFVRAARVKRKVLKMVVRPAVMNDLETVALTKRREVELKMFRS